MTVSPAGPVARIDDLAVSFATDAGPVRAVDGVSLEVAPGEVLAIVGESGSGKSTSSMALLGLLPENARVTGSIKLLGRQLRGVDDATLRSLRGNDIAVIFQEPMTALNPVYTIGFQITEALRSHDRTMVPTARPRCLANSGVNSEPTMPRMSYSRKISLGTFMDFFYLVAASLRGRDEMGMRDKSSRHVDVTTCRPPRLKL